MAIEWNNGQMASASLNVFQGYHVPAASNMVHRAAREGSAADTLRSVTSRESEHSLADPLHASSAARVSYLGDHKSESTHCHQM